MAGLMPLTEYLDLTARFRGERDKNVWIDPVRLAHHAQPDHAAGRPAAARGARARPLAPRWPTLGWTPRPGEDELTRQLRGDLIRALGTLGNDRPTQARAAELLRRPPARRGHRRPNVLPALIAVLAHAGDAARYDEFLQRFRAATTPQEEQRYLYALAAFRQPELVEQTLGQAPSTARSAPRTRRSWCARC